MADRAAIDEGIEQWIEGGQVVWYPPAPPYHKVAINSRYGGFGVSIAVLEWMAQRGHLVALETIEEFRAEYPDWRSSFNDWDCYGVDRHDPYLIAAIEALGDRASDGFSLIRIVPIKGTKYIIREYDGMESVVEPEDIQWVSSESP